MDFPTLPLIWRLSPPQKICFFNRFNLPAKKVLWVEWAVTAVILLLIAAAVVIFNKPLHQSFRWLAVGAPVFALLLFYGVSIRKAFPYLAYAVREKDIVHQRGWLVRRLRICPFNRVQI